MDTPFTVPRLVKEGAWLDLRDRWQGGREMYGTRSLENIRFFAPHHSVTNPTGNALKDVDTLANIHINGNGWAGIGYNFVVTSEVVNGFAVVAYVGDIATIRAHTPNTKGSLGMAAGLGNHYIVAACTIGQNHINMPSEAQLRSMKLLAQEFLWFEDERMPNLWNTWDDMQEHYVWDWTQCNGKPEIRQAIINVEIPSDAPAPAPVAAWSLMDNQRFMRAKEDLYVINLDNNQTVGSVIPAGRDIDFVSKKDQNGTTYLRSRSSHDAGRNWGIDIRSLVEIPAPAPAPTPAPVPQPVEEKPIVRALGVVEKVLVGSGDKVVDVITGEVKKTYTQDEPFDATHTIEFKGTKYYMTTYSYLQYTEKGKNPVGVDVTTVESMVVVPEAPEVPEIPPHEGEKPPVDEDLKNEHDAIVEELKGQRTLMEKILALLEWAKPILDKLKSLIDNIQKGDK
jgi:hypothetical protein